MKSFVIVLNYGTFFFSLHVGTNAVSLSPGGIRHPEIRPPKQEGAHFHSSGRGGEGASVEVRSLSLRQHREVEELRGEKAKIVSVFVEKFIDLGGD